MLTERVPGSEGRSVARDLLSLIGWIGLLAGLGVGMTAAFGPPHPPTPWPSWREVESTLRSSEVPTDALIYALATISWILWGYLSLTTLLQLVVGVACAFVAGSAIARQLLCLGNLITIPFIRRLVNGLIVTLTVARLIGPLTQVASAAPEPSPIVRLIPRDDARALGNHRVPPPPQAAAASDARATTYIVKKGDTLAGIALRFLGDEAKWRDIWEANRGRLMQPGVRFADPNLIRPGWEIRVPEGAAPRYDSYTVVEGDSLWGIAESELGDGMRWREVWELNEGCVMADGESLADPRLIRTGWRLLLPRPPRVTEAPPPVDTSARREPAEAMTREANLGRSQAPAESAPAPPPKAPTAAPITPAPTVTAATPAPAPEATPAAAGPTIALPDGRILAGTAGIALTGLLAFAIRRRAGGAGALAEALRAASPGSLLATLRQRLDEHLETDKVAVVTNRLWALLAGWGLAETELQSCVEGRDSLVYACRGRSDSVARLAERALAIGEEFGCRARALVGPGGSLTLTLSRLPYRAMVESSRPDFHHHAPLLLPLGVLPDGRTLHLNLARGGGLLAVSAPGAGADVFLQSLIVSLAAQAHYRQVGLVIVGERGGALAGLAGLPHLVRPIVNRGDAAGLAAALDDLGRELARRIGLLHQADVVTFEEYAQLALADSTLERLPYLVVVIDDLAALPRIGSTIGVVASLGIDGPQNGLVVVAGSSSVASLDDALLDAFSTRVAFRLADSSEATRLLGGPDAETLAEDGEFLLRRPRQEPLHLHGFRLAAEDVAECVRLMVAARDTAEGRPAGVASDSANGGLGGGGVVASADDVAPVEERPETEYLALGPEAAALPPDDEAPGDAVVVTSLEPMGATDTGPAGAEAGSAEEDGAETDRRAVSGGVANGAEASGKDENGAKANDDCVVGELDATAPLPTTPVVNSNGHGERADVIPDDSPVAPSSSAATDDSPDGESRNGSPNGSAKADACPIRVYCLGRFRVFRGDVELTRKEGPADGGEGGDARYKSAFRQKARELLAYFAAYPHLDHARDTIQEAIWPDDNPDHSLRGFNQNLWIVRHFLAGGAGADGNLRDGRVFISQDGGVYRLQPGLVWVDSQEFQRLATKADRLARTSPEGAAALRERAIALYHGDFLQHTYYDWASGDRDRMKVLYLHVLSRQVDYLRRARELDRATELVLRALKAERFSERLHRQLMLLYAETSNWPALVKHYETLSNAIRNEIGVEPEPATERLYQELIARRAGPGAEPGEQAA